MLGLALASGFFPQAATASGFTQGQSVREEPPTEKKAVRFGAKLGVNFANMNFNQGFPKPVTPIETTWKTGAVAGFFLQIPLLPKLSLQQEYLFSQLGAARTSTATTYRLRYLSLPLLLQYKVLPKLAFVAGPQFDLLLQATARTNGATTTITHDTEERSIGATAGLSFYITDHISLDARYLQGLNHIGIGQRSDVLEFKHQMVQVAAAVRF
ncbi:hypothetical protein BXP70_12575 [Hymenobacter crusticola]|uniref:Outer membrane protein beta-barrel domain-containing protein n=2 Tax=Hymenobacter crusticola TaxID=1770526 RepID=A0A243WDS5_9BACT|nr:hypothetical protein BXP70_12575 [Hymenobacter crusticola]